MEDNLPRLLNRRYFGGAGAAVDLLQGQDRFSCATDGLRHRSERGEFLQFLVSDRIFESSRIGRWLRLPKARLPAVGSMGLWMCRLLASRLFRHRSAPPYLRTNGHYV